MITGDKDFINYSLYKMDRKRLARELSGKCLLLYSTGEWSFIIERKTDKAVIGFINLDSELEYIITSLESVITWEAIIANEAICKNH